MQNLNNYNNTSATSVRVGFIHPETQQKIYLDKDQIMTREGEQQETFCLTKYGNKSFSSRTTARTFKRNFDRVSDLTLFEDHTGLNIDLTTAQELCGYLGKSEVKNPALVF